MMPSQKRLELDVEHLDRRLFLKFSIGGMLFSGLSIGAGCSATSILRSQSPEEHVPGSDTKLVGDIAMPIGLNAYQVEAIGLVTGLEGTGSDPQPSAQKSLLLDEMKKRGVQNPQQILSSPDTEIVLVRAYLRPGIQKGDHFDVEVRALAQSDAASLRGGWLLQSRLKDMAVLEGQIREGSGLALAEGPILVDPAADGDADRMKLLRGRILGGGVCRETRKLGLVLRDGFQNVMASNQLGNAVNARFHRFSTGVKQGVATPENDKFIQLAVHPRYKDNVERYIRVVRSLALRETPAERLARLALLERMLLDPITSANAALRLEAIGKEAVKSLTKGIKADNEEVRFYSAEALAYLDQTEAVAPLAAAARQERAFRAYALTALSAMDDYEARAALKELLDASSAETRYGAFRALWAMNTRDALVQGENLNDQFSYHLIESKGPPMVHLTRSYRAEVVLFGPYQQLKTPFVLDAGKHIQVISHGGDEVTVSRFGIKEQDQKRVVSRKLDEVIRTVVDLGGTYPDVFQALQQAKAQQALESRFEIDALPQGGRWYDRRREDGESEDDGKDFVVANPLPGLFSSRISKSDDGSRRKKRRRNEENEPPKRSLLDKITGSD
ncbi:MAG TPA: flagellar basal body P-ring protein FlgI [Pirellulales bacterium]|nr:flagellar basal body P-ring protein FlgI [Pirellulales bacterium]